MSAVPEVTVGGAAHTPRLSSEEGLETTIPVLALDLGSLKCVEPKAVNLSDWGCKLVGEGIGPLPDDHLFYIHGFDKPARTEVAWRKDISAGLWLILNGGKIFG